MLKFLFWERPLGAPSTSSAMKVFAKLVLGTPSLALAAVFSAADAFGLATGCEVV